jgi:hypothetical protein
MHSMSAFLERKRRISLRLHYCAYQRVLWTDATFLITLCQVW